MTIRKICAAAMAFSLASGSAWADDCLNAQDADALKTADLQQELMVAALTCDDVALYNRFVVSYRTQLQQSDHSLEIYFQRVHARTGEADYHAYKTKLANQSSLDRLHDPLYCAKAKAAFDEALESNKTLLSDIVAQRAVPNGENSATCEQSEAAAGGSYAVTPLVRTANRPN